jgi:hypothetical protein
MVQADDIISTYVSVDHKLSVENDNGNCIVLSFKEKNPISISFRSHVGSSRGVLKIPRDVHGIGAAISTFGDYHLTDTPDRSYPSMRGHPPHLEFTSEPKETRSSINTQDDRLKLRLPGSLELLFKFVPFAYYTGAEVIPTSHRNVEISS